jgi:hypothetical protein
MKMTCELQLLKLNLSAYNKVVSKELTQKLKEGVGVWIQKAVSIIPVWMGASHGTFIKLAAKIGMTFSVSGLGGIPGFPGPAEGNRQSQGRLVTWGGNYMAEYSTTLWHLIYNETHNANENKEEARVFYRLINPTPYHFQSQANAAFAAYISNVRLPSPWAYLTLEVRKVS